MNKDEAMGGERCQCSHGKKLRLTRMGARGHIVKDLICSAKEFRLCPKTPEATEGFSTIKCEVK